MAKESIPNMVKETWRNWNIHGLVVTSLALQIFLILFAPLRKRTNASMLSLFLWSAYLLADYVATFCIGRIFDKRESISTTSVQSHILVLRAPFLLLHLGGPDTITAFSLEDNELWLRHLLALVTQVAATVYVFYLTVPGNTLWIPTVLVFVAGMIKYTERTRSLYLASIDTFRKSVVVGDPNSSFNYSKHEQGDDQNPSTGADQTTDVELMCKAFQYFDRFKGLIVDMTYSFSDRNKSRSFLINRTAAEVLTVMEVELNFIYEFFFTKVSVLRTKMGYLFRLGSFCTIVAALLVFTLEKNHDFSMLDVTVTYVLFFGAMALEIVAFLMVVFSDRTVIFCFDGNQGSSNKVPVVLVNKFKATLGNLILNHFLNHKKSRWSTCKNDPHTNFNALSTSPLFRRWSGKISGHDLITYCLHKSKEDKQKGIVKFLKLTSNKIIEFFGATELVEKWKYKTNNPFLKELWEFIFSDLQRKSKDAGDDEEKVKKICEARGAWVIEEGNKPEQTSICRLMSYVDCDKVAFDESLILWHIGTNLCFYADAKEAPNMDANASNHRHISKLLSNYMLYLLAMEPKIISAVAGVGQKRILEIMSSLMDTSMVASNFFSMRDLNQDNPANSACEKLMDAYNGIEPLYGMGFWRKSLLLDACKLTKELRALPETVRWKIIAQVWVEMLSFAAINCRPDSLVQQLSKGGQLISLVWLLMVHLGLGIRQFQTN